MQHLISAQANAFEVAAVARQHSSLGVTDIKRWRHAVSQGLDKLQLIVEHALGLEPGFDLPTQVKHPHQ
ncbi:hypothetical protein D3C80_855040 [compost metagenome]